MFTSRANSAPNFQNLILASLLRRYHRFCEAASESACLLQRSLGIPVDYH